MTIIPLKEYPPTKPVLVEMQVKRFTPEGSISKLKSLVNRLDWSCSVSYVKDDTGEGTVIFVPNVSARELFPTN